MLCGDCPKLDATKMPPEWKPRPVCCCEVTERQRPARLFIEAFCGLNDIFPGDPYPPARS